MGLSIATMAVIALAAPLRPPCGAWSARLRRSSIVYQGGLLGVDATVVLFEKRGQATIQLKGVPLGGRISGVARFEPDGVTVDLDSDLGRALARRHVKITRAGVYLDYSTVWVTVRLPLGVGERTVHLARTVTLQHENSNEFP